MATSPSKDETRLKGPTIKANCQRCGKAIAPPGPGPFLTGWIFKPDGCQCAETSGDLAKSAGDVPQSSSQLSEGSASEDAGTFPKLGERYEVLGRIGRGGMGSVYKVRDKDIDAILAVKVLQQDLVQDQAALKRFEQEADAAKKLSHSNLVSVYGHGATDDGAPYIVMDYLDGKGLADILKESTTLDSQRAVKIFVDICEALAYAHKEGVIHRDIKPTNIIITDEGKTTERAHIVDFGIAKVMPTANRETHDLTQTGEIFGSPHYMSPEQCLGFMLDSRSDIYSLGCLMYEALTGGAPFEGANPIQVVVKHINEEPAEFSRAVKVDRRIEHLESVVLRCLDKDKAERYQNADEVIKDLNLIKSGKAINKYSRTGKVKPMFTKRQTLGFLVVFMGLTVYGTMTAITFNNEIGGKVLGALLSLVCLAGVWVFYSSAMEVFRKRVKVLTETNTWRMLLLFSMGTACLTALQYPSMIMFGWSSWPSDEFPRQLFFWNGFVHVTSLACCAITGLSCLTFRSPKALNPAWLAAKFALVACLLTAFCTFVIPTQTGKVAATLGSACSNIKPVAAKNCFQVAALLDKTNIDHLQRLAEANHKLNLHDDELKNYLEIVKREPGPWRMQLAAQAFKEHQNPDKALQWFNKTVAAARSDSSKSFLPNALYQRATFLRQIGDYVNSRNDWLELYKLQRSEENTRNLAQIDCIVGNFGEAKDMLEKAIAMSSSTGLVKEHVLLGIVYDNLGLPSLARQHFQEVSDKFYPGRIAPEGNEIPIGYAHQQSGRMTKADGDWAPNPKDKARLLEILGVPGAPLTVKW